MRVSVISANLGAYDQLSEWPALQAPDDVRVSIHRFTDANFPPRSLAMTSRLQCAIPKWFGYQFAPEADVLIWIDASCTPTPDAVSWFIDRLGVAELALFAHPDRRTIQQEYDFIRTRMQRPGETYLTSRYRGEWLDDQFAEIQRCGFAGAQLFASTAFAYRPTPKVRALLKEVFFGKARYHLHDQLWLAYAVAASTCRVNVMPESYLHCPALTFTRTRRRAS